MILSTSGPQVPSVCETTTTLSLPDFSAQLTTLDPGVPPVVGRNATFCLTPLHDTSAYRCELSPFRNLTRSVVVVAALLTTPLNVAVPPVLPPMYPAAEPPLHPLQVIVLAPLVRTAASPSGWLSLGPTVHAPALATLGIQLTWLAIVTFVPENVSGSHTYVDATRLVDTQRSPMYIVRLSDTGRM